MYVSKHYSSVNDPAEFRAKMEALALELPRVRHEYGVEVWMVTGKSGIVAMAGMALLAPDEPFMSIRKPEEETNGGFAEGSGAAASVFNTFREESNPRRLGIVDDFVSSGNTVARMMRQIKEKALHCELAVVVSYNTHEPTRRVKQTSYPGGPHGGQRTAPYVMVGA